MIEVFTGTKTHEVRLPLHGQIVIHNTTPTIMNVLDHDGNVIAKVEPKSTVTFETKWVIKTVRY